MPELNMAEALQQRKARHTSFQALQYIRFVADYRNIPRGSVICDQEIVFGYPGIGRILALQQGLEEQFSAPFWVEEKVDGYNVRIARFGEEILALTRGGFVCPFTTDRLPDLLDLSIFDKQPDLVLCGEVVGPENPYQESAPPFVDEDVRLLVFDLMRVNQAGFVPHKEKYQLIERFHLPVVECFGCFSATDVNEIQAILKHLNDEQREGVVFKEDTDRNRRAKYVTSNSSIADIRATAANILELPPEYFTNRIMRLVLFLHEQGLTHSQVLDERLGAAFLDGLLDSIQQYEKEQKVYHTFRCRFRHKENAHLLLMHLQHAGKHKIHINHRELRLENGYWILEFDRTYPALNGLLGHLVKGGLIFD
jgi:putative ATP-dependent DNA ligase